MFITIYLNLFIKDNIVGDSKTSVHSFNDFKWFSTIIKISKLYKVEGTDGIIKTTITNIVELDFFYYNKSIYKNTIEAVYILKILMNLIFIKKLQIDNIIYNRFNHIITIESIKQKITIFI